MTAEYLAQDYAITREQQDEYALQSHARAEAAQKAGAFADEIAKVVIAGRKGDVVVDLGCAPGSWLQYVESHIGDTGRAFGIDLLPVKVAFSAQVRVLQGDAFTVSLSDLVGAADGELIDVNVVLSDMAPNTTGIRSVDADRSMALS